MDKDQRVTMGRLSRVHLLPVAFDGLLAELLDAMIVAKRSTQLQALATLNEHLKKEGLPLVAHSSWSRFVIGQLNNGIDERWRRKGGDSEAVSVPRARYMELLEIESAHRKLNAL
jgi:hypothetical protein